jgi:hypothetical protein
VVQEQIVCSGILELNRNRTDAEKVKTAGKHWRKISFKNLIRILRIRPRILKIYYEL